MQVQRLDHRDFSADAIGHDQVVGEAVARAGHGRRVRGCGDRGGEAGGIANMVASLAQMLGDRGIRANSVAPGPISNATWTPRCARPAIRRVSSPPSARAAPIPYERSQV